jgi:hypothetical protein
VNDSFCVDHGDVSFDVQYHPHRSDGGARAMHDRIQTRTVMGGAPAPLAYVRPGVLPRRPAVLTAVAVVGLIYASVGFLVNVSSFTFHAGVWWLEPPPAKVVPPPPIPAISVEPYDGDPAGADGLKRAERDAVVGHVRERITLPDDRAEMLRRLLADVGQRVPRDVNPLDPGARLVIESGRVPGPDGSGPRASHYFLTPRGRIELSDFTATFMLDGTTPVRLVRNVLYDGDAPPRWSSIAVGEMLDELHARSRGRMTAYQAAALSRVVRGLAPDEPKDWDARPRAWLPTFWDRGTLSYHTSRFTRRGNGFWLLPDGRGASFVDAPLGVDPVTGVPHVRAAPPPVRYWPGSRGAFALLALDGLLGAILSAYLFAGAILVLRDMPTGPERLARFLVAKVPLVLLGAFALMWWGSSLHAYWQVWPLRAARQVWSFVPLIVLALPVYPLALLIVLRSRGVRRYFAAHGIDVWHPLRRWHERLVALPAARAIGASLLPLALLHVVLAVGCASADGHLDVRALSHLLCAILDGGIAAAMLRPRTTGWAVRAVGLFCLISCGTSIARAQPSTSPAAPAAPPSPWAVEDLLAQARNADGPAAVNAVLRLARAGDVGQDALLSLLDGAVPAIGVDGVLDTVGQAWFDTGARWAPQFRRRALRLSLEWVELIERAPHVSRIAALEAMGPDPDLEPLLRPLLSSPNTDVRERGARLLLRINPRPEGVVRLLRRDLATEPDRAARERIVSGLVHLRPTSDAALAQLLTGGDAPTRDAALVALLRARQPLTGELLAAAEQLARLRVDALYEPRVQLLALGSEGRNVLIRMAFESEPAAAAARAVLEQTWPATEAVFRRLRRATAGPGRDRAEAAAQRILRQLNKDPSGLDHLAGNEDDAELRAQALIVLADREYTARLGPATLRLLDVHPTPAPALRWTTDLPIHADRWARRGPPPWLSRTVWFASLLSLVVLLAMSSRAGQRYGSSASERM